MLANAEAFSIVREAAELGQQENAKDGTPLPYAAVLTIVFAFVASVWSGVKLRRRMAIYKGIRHQDLLITLGYWTIPSGPMLFGVDSATDGKVEPLAFMYLIAVALHRLFASGLFCPEHGGDLYSPLRPKAFMYGDRSLITVALHSRLTE